MPGLRHTTAFHFDVNENGRPVTAEERERLIAPYLPERMAQQEADAAVTESTRGKSRPKASSPRKRSVQQPVKHFVKTTLHLLLYNIIQFLFSVYIRLRKAYHNVTDTIRSVLYYHHHQPEYIRKDLAGLTKLPQHLSIILELQENEHSAAGLEALVHDVCEVVAWSACAGIPVLSIYEKTGVLKSSLPHLHRRISRTLSRYYGTTNPAKPTVSLRAPHMQSFSPPSSPPAGSASPNTPPHVSILLLSASDGRRTLVDLTKTLAEMSQKGKLAPSDVSIDLVDAEISESVMGEPDLVMLFGEQVILQGYPPWQIRLSEIFHVQDNNGVGYQVFLRGLRNYAAAQMRMGA